MPLSVSTQVSPVGSKLIAQTSVGATPDNNVTGAAGTLYMVDVDNTANTVDPAYLKVYSDAAPVVGTTPPDLVFLVGVNKRRAFVVPEGWSFTALSFACVTAGGTAGVTAPTSPVVVRMVAS
jgi:hypothetical protein